MNETPESDTDVIRSEIENTRRHMDDTMDALGERLKGRHLFDEILGFFRSDNPNSKAAEIREKVSRTAGTAVRSVADGVKANPVPTLLIGAGIAWMIYSSRKSSRPSWRDDDEDFDAGVAYDPDAAYDHPLEYPTAESRGDFRGQDDEATIAEIRDYGEEGAGESKLGEMKSGLQEKATHAKEQVKEKLSTVGDQLRQKAQTAGQRAREVGSRVRARTREVYVQTRDKVVTTADQHPLEVGLACLAAGIAVGLALPTPEKVNRVAGPAMDRLRQRTRAAGGEYLEKGKRVVNAAGAAIKNEAQQQGLTLDRFRQKTEAVADKAKGAVTEAARQEGVAPGAPGASQPNAPARAATNVGPEI